MRYLELNADGRVINVIVWDGITPYDSGYTLIPSADAPHATFGWQLIDGSWIAPPADPSEIEQEETGDNPESD